MPESYIGLPVDAFTGKKFRARERTVGSTTVLEQSISPAPSPTYWVWAPAQACAGGKYFLAFLNAVASGQYLTVKKLFIVNAQLAAIVSGVTPSTVGQIQIDVRRITAIVAGTAITANPIDTVDGALTNYTAVYSPTTCTDSTLLYSWFTNNDEIGVTGDIWMAIVEQFASSLAEGDFGEFKEFEVGPGEGFAVKMITNYTLGQFGVLAVLTKET
jgi:hypothetical protein